MNLQRTTILDITRRLPAILGIFLVLLLHSAATPMPTIANAPKTPLLQKNSSGEAVSWQNYALLPESWARKSAKTRVMPAYPEEAIRRGLSGVVSIKFETNDQGEVLRIKVAPRTESVLANVVASAVKRWKFRIRRAQDGSAKPVISRLTFNFILDTVTPRVELYDPGPHPPDVQGLGYYNSAKEMREWRHWQEVLTEPSSN